MAWINNRGYERTERVEYIDKEKYYCDKNNLTFVIDHLQDEVARLNKELDCGTWGDRTSMRLKAIEDKLYDLAEKGTMKRRRVTVRAGNQVVEVVRNG